MPTNIFVDNLRGKTDIFVVYMENYLYIAGFKRLHAWGIGLYHHMTWRRTDYQQLMFSSENLEIYINACLLSVLSLQVPWLWRLSTQDIEAWSPEIQVRCTWWCDQMETCSALLAFWVGIHRSPVNSPHKGQWRGALMFSLVCAWTNDLVNNRNAGDLGRHRARYDVNIMTRHRQQGSIR